MDWPLIVTPDEVMVFCSDTNAWDGTTDQQYVDVVRRAYQEMRKVVAARMGCSISEANAVVAAALDIRNCALYGLAKLRSEGRHVPVPPIAISPWLVCYPDRSSRRLASVSTTYRDYLDFTAETAFSQVG